MPNKLIENTKEKLDLNYLQVFKYGKEHKNKPLLVFIHGFYTDHRCFEPIYKDLSKDYLCLCFNLPGCGDQNIEKYPLRYLRLDNMAKLVAKYIVENDLNDFILIGHSMGAAIASMVNLELKNTRIKKLVLLAPYNVTSIPKVVDKAFMFNIKTREKFDDLQKMVFYDFEKSIKNIGEDHNRYYKEMQMFYNRNQKYSYPIMVDMSGIITLKKLNESYEKINIDTYLLVADHDKLVDLYLTCKYLSNKVKDLKMYIFKECGHAFYVEEKKLFLELFERIINDKEKRNTEKIVKL